MMFDYYGEMFLKKYNEINNLNIGAEKFFNDELLQFFDIKRGYYVNNSIFENNSNKNDKISTKHDKFKVKINSNDDDGSIFIGGSANGLDGNTSFGVSFNYQHKITPEKKYLSWVGAAFGIRIGNYNYLFNDQNILYDIYLGWEKYFKLVNSDSYAHISVDINTWNAHWIENKYSVNPISNDRFNPFETETYKNKESKYSLKNKSWIRIIFALSNKFGDKTINAYAYNFGKCNKTPGNFIFKLKKIKKFYDFCFENLNKNNTFATVNEYEEIFNSNMIGLFGGENKTLIDSLLLENGFFDHKSLERCIDYNKKEKNENFEHFKLKTEILKTYIMMRTTIEEIDTIAQNLAKMVFKLGNEKRRNFDVKDFILVKNLNELNKGLSDIHELYCELFPEESKLNELTNIFKLMSNDPYELINLRYLLKMHYNELTKK